MVIFKNFYIKNGSFRNFLKTKYTPNCTISKKILEGHAPEPP